MTQKTLTRFNINNEYLELIITEADKRSLSRHEFINYVLYEFLVKKENRLSNHVARDVENLVLMLLTSNTTYKNIEDVFQHVKLIDMQKREFLHEHKHSKQDKSFWRQILQELHPSQFISIKTQKDANEKITTLYTIVKEHKELFQ